MNASTSSFLSFKLNNFHRASIRAFVLLWFVAITSSMQHYESYEGRGGQKFQKFHKFLGFRYEVRITPDLPIHLLVDDDDQEESVGEKIMMKLKDIADQSFCFGWTQRTYTGAVVGEVRCHETAGYKFQKFLLLKEGGLESWILNDIAATAANRPEQAITANKERNYQEGGDSSTERKEGGGNSSGGGGTTGKLLETSIRVYKDTKIKLHFSHFKILDMARITCFRDKPHQCQDEDLFVTLW
jgi:uncharacterized membrane protein YgcG